MDHFMVIFYSDILIRTSDFFLFNILEKMRKPIDIEKTSVALTPVKLIVIIFGTITITWAASQVWTNIVKANRDNSQAVIILKEQDIKKTKHDSVIDAKLNRVDSTVFYIAIMQEINKTESALKDARLARAIMNKIPSKDRHDTIYAALEIIATPTGLKPIQYTSLKPSKFIPKHLVVKKDGDSIWKDLK
jgi:hypothetical protein